MANHVVTTRDYFRTASIIAGDTYDVSVLGGVYELVTRSTSYSTGVTVSRLMPDGTTYVAERAAITADGPVLLTLGTGIIRFGFAAAGTAFQIVFERCDKL